MLLSPPALFCSLPARRAIQRKPVAKGSIMTAEQNLRGDCLAHQVAELEVRGRRFAFGVRSRAVRFGGTT